MDFWESWKPVAPEMVVSQCESGQTAKVSEVYLGNFSVIALFCHLEMGVQIVKNETVN